MHDASIDTYMYLILIGDWYWYLVSAWYGTVCMHEFLFLFLLHLLTYLHKMYAYYILYTMDITYHVDLSVSNVDVDVLYA